MKLKEFLQLKNPEQYDISGENAIAQYINFTPCQKYIAYKAYTISNDWADIFADGRDFSAKIKEYFTEKNGRKIVRWIGDPDSESELLQQIYAEVWPFMFDEDSNKFWSDTMSSVQYTMSDIFETYIENKEAKQKRDSLGYKQNCTIRYMIDYFSKMSDSLDICERIIMSATEIERIPNINKFLSAWHTLGNYCPVPKGFNSPRSNYGKHDMWDLTLMMIRNWYLSSNNISKKRILVEDLFHFNKFADIENVEKWLISFGDGEEGWEKFVNTFLFQDWVNTVDADSEEYYAVLPLCEERHWGNALTPLNNLDVFFDNYQARIIKRGERILKKLREGK